MLSSLAIFSIVMLLKPDFLITFAKAVKILFSSGRSFSLILQMASSSQRRVLEMVSTGNFALTISLRPRFKKSTSFSENFPSVEDFFESSLSPSAESAFLAPKSFSRSLMK